MSRVGHLGRELHILYISLQWQIYLFALYARFAFDDFKIAAQGSSSRPRFWQRRALSKTVYLGTKALSLAGLRNYPFHVIQIRGEETYDLGSEQFAATLRSNRHILASGWLFRSERLFQKHASAVHNSDASRPFCMVVPMPIHRVTGIPSSQNESSGLQGAL